MPQESDWRSGAAYDYIDQLNTSDLAWEFLRRNREYRESYYELARRGHFNGEQARSFAEHWGLSLRFGTGIFWSPPADLLYPDTRTRRRPPRPTPCNFRHAGDRSRLDAPRRPRRKRTARYAHVS